jgi:predicted acetyltransferase
MVVRGAQAEAELEIVADMQMAAFAPTGMVLEFRPRRLERLRERFALHQTRLVEDKGQIVAVLNVVDRQMRMGTATVRFGGLSGVVTFPEHRRKGYARVLLEDTLD